MNTNIEVAKAITIAAIEKGLFLNVSSHDLSIDQDNLNTAKNIAEAYKTIYNAVKEAHRQ